MVINAFYGANSILHGMFCGMNVNGFIQVKTKINLLFIVNDKQFQPIQ